MNLQELVSLIEAEIDQVNTDDPYRNELVITATWSDGKHKMVIKQNHRLRYSIIEALPNGAEIVLQVISHKEELLGETVIKKITNDKYIVQEDEDYEA